MIVARHEMADRFMPEEKCARLEARAAGRSRDGGQVLERAEAPRAPARGLVLPKGGLPERAIDRATQLGGLRSHLARSDLRERREAGRLGTRLEPAVQSIEEGSRG